VSGEFEDDLVRRLHAFAAEEDRRIVGSFESSVAHTADVRDVPDPLDWHPAYADRTWLLDWLNGVGPYGDRREVLLPILPSPLRSWSPDGPTVPATLRTRVLTRRLCQGGAPYVGRPFVYQWWAAVDELGRAIAGESWRVYQPESP